MRNASAIVRRLIEAPEDDLDWAHDPTDPEEVADLGSAIPTGVPGAGAITGGYERLVKVAAEFTDRAKEHTGGFTQRKGHYRPSPNNPNAPPYFTFPHGTRIAKLDDRTFIVYWPDGSIGLQVHGTVVLKRDPDANYTVNSGGYKTSITAKRLNDYLPAGWDLFIKRSENEFYWINMTNRAGMYDDPEGRLILFQDGDEILNNGWLIPQAPITYRNKKRERGA